MNCNRCGNLMVDAVTTFTVVREGEVYVVEDVPCLECPVCEHISFTQDVARTLERYSSGRVLPTKSTKAWVFRWGTPIIEIPRTEVEASTTNTPLAITTVGTLSGPLS